jgi:SAM-dependent methyltransferase
MTIESLRLATRAYYWKPPRAFFRAFELEEFAGAGVRFTPPVLDLGCGDGVLSALLIERGVVDRIHVGLDYSMAELERARDVLGRVVRADIRALPLETERIGSVLSNAVLSSLPTGDEADIDRSIAEVHRVLAEGGVFVLTVATSWFNRNLLRPRILRKLATVRLAERHLERVDRGHDHYQVYDEEKWLRKLERNGFRVEHVRYYFTPRQARWYDALTLQMMRVFAFSKLLGAAWVRRGAGRIQEMMLRPLIAREQAAPPEQKRQRAGFLLIVARRTGERLPPQGE